VLQYHQLDFKAFPYGFLLNNSTILHALCTVSAEIMSTAAELYKKILFEEGLLEDHSKIQGHRKCCYLVGHMSLSIIAPQYQQH